MFPISDDNSRPGTPYVTWGLIGACVLVFLWELSLTDKALEAAFYRYGAVAAQLTGAGLQGAGAMPAHVSADWSTLVTSMFLHGGLAHIAGNMLYLWIFGDNVELAMGRVRFILFYLACGIVAALAQIWMSPTSAFPLIGASGAISGVLGAYLMLYPYGRVRVLILPFPIIILRVIEVPAMLVLGFWFVLQLLSGIFSNPAEPGVAFAAHVGGFLAGMVLVLVARQPGVPLFERPRPRSPWDRRRGGRRGPWG
ncbi:rhomboid family intramembrane serine protease [Parvibaculum sp. MBR-TMA-1.3b-4.2]|jgi:membrane associated rhomboid family serine protease